MEQINYEEEIKAAIDSRDEEAFRRLLSIDYRIIGYFFRVLGVFVSSVGEENLSIFKKRRKAMLYAAKKGWTWAVVELVELGTKPDYEDKHGWTPFNWAIWHAHFDCAKFLLENHADKQHVDRGFLNMSSVAAYYGHYECLKFLIENEAHIYSYDRFDESSLTAAACGGQTECLEFLIKNGVDVEVAGFALYNAVVHNRFNCANLLVKSGADIGFQPTFGDPALFIAVENNYVDILRLLVENKADSGKTALYTAAYRGHTECVELLVRNGANLNCLDKFDWTALRAAASSGHFLCVQTLVEYGADHRIATKYRMKVIDSARGYEVKKYIRYLDEKEPDWMFACRTGKFLKAKRMLDEDSSIDINEIGIGGNTALHFIARANNTKVYNLFVSKGADQNIENDVYSAS